MRIDITITCNNAAFGDESDNAGPEVARILRELADRAECDQTLNDMPNSLRDINGNKVGTVGIWL